MKKVMVAVDDEKLLKNIKIEELKNEKIIIKKIQYREGILENLKNDKKIDFLILNENIPGQISIEELIKKIKKINKKIKIIFLFKKKEIEKEKKLKELKIDNIFNIEKNKKIYLINKLIKKQKKKKCKKYKIKKNIIILGKNKLEKINFIYLIIYYLINKNKKLLLININKRYINNKLNKKEKKEEKFKKISFKISNEKDKYNFENYILKAKEKYDYIIINIGYIENNEIVKKLPKKEFKIMYVLKSNLLGIKELIENQNNIFKIFKSNNQSLHIVYINNYLLDISGSLIRKICLKKFEIQKIFLKEKNINLKEKFIKNEKFKINYKNRKILKKILK